MRILALLIASFYWMPLSASAQATHPSQNLVIQIRAQSLNDVFPSGVPGVNQSGVSNTRQIIPQVSPVVLTRWALLANLAPDDLRPVAYADQSTIVVELGPDVSQSAEGVADSLALDEAVELAEPGARVFPEQSAPRIAETNIDYVNQWGFGADAQYPGAANFGGAWQSNIGSRAINVSVLDTGILPSHPEFTSENVVGGMDHVSNEFRANDGDGVDDNFSDPGDWCTNTDVERGLGTRETRSTWHGSHVAGTIAALTNNLKFGAGGADVSLVVQRVLGRCGGDMADFPAAIRWAVGIPVPGLTTNARPAKVINMSLGAQTRCPRYLQRAFDEATARNAVIVVAAGNLSTEAATFAPANCSGVVVVAAHDQLGRFAGFSNFGTTVTVSGPGVAVRSAVDTGTTTPVSSASADYSGTSMAAPHVAAAVSLLLSAHPDLTPDKITALLRASARPFVRGSGCFQGEESDGKCGAGYLDADYLLKLAAGSVNPRTVERTTPTPNPESPSDQSSGSEPMASDAGSEHCFIATAAFGTPSAPDVIRLRKFRDRTLTQTAIGRRSIDFYYSYSPAIANWIRDREPVKAIVRKALRVVLLVIDFLALPA